jgi:predicted DNA-binding transcriptional regulator YafY
MYSPATRLLTLLDLLQTRPGITALQLAERLEVNTRSVRRYVTMLQDLGMPVESTRGRYGGYRLGPGFKLPPLMFSNDEAVAVTLGLLAAKGLGLSDILPAVEGALTRVERVLPVAIREQVQAVQEAVRIDLIASQRLPSALDQVLLLSKAAYQGQRVYLQYLNSAGVESERFFDCYGLLYRAGTWYAVGYCHLREDTRIFRLDRVRALRLDAEHFQVPRDFNCLEYAVQAFAAIPERWLIEALLETTLEQANLRVPSAFATLTERADGVLVRAYVPALSHAAHFLLGLGCPFRILQPPELLQELEQFAHRLLESVALNRSNHH